MAADNGFTGFPADAISAHLASHNANAWGVSALPMRRKGAERLVDGAAQPDQLHAPKLLQAEP